MNSHEHKHSHGHQNQHHPGHRRKGLHKDWRTWAVVLLMLAAMAMYLRTMDESIPPGATLPGGSMPAAPAPPVEAAP